LSPRTTDYGDLPYIVSFQLEEGEIYGTPHRIIAEKIDISNVVSIPQFEIFGDRILYARCQRRMQQDGAVFSSEKSFKESEWLIDEGELSFWGVKAIPGYHET
jgi:hypothetical protein